MRKRKYFNPMFKSSGMSQEELDEASNAYINELKGVISRTTRNKIRALYAKKVTKEEDIIVNNMLGFMTDPLEVAHFFLGGHIQLEGNGIESYKKWHDGFRDNVIYRSSSHVSVDRQFGLNGKVLGHILVGTRYKDPKDESSDKYTWIQLENNPIGGLKEFLKSPIAFIISAVLHLLDYFDYKISKQNIGRWGRSKYTEASPLKIDVSNTTPEIMQRRSELWKTIILDRQGNISGLKESMREVGIKLPDKYIPKTLDPSNKKI